MLAITRLALSGVICALGAAYGANPPRVGEVAPDFTLARAVDKASVRLSQVNASSRVALIVLRGFPGYQCPFCNRQVHDLIRNAKSLAGLRVILVYPGPAAGMDANAKEFLAGKEFPANFDLLVDPDYKVTELYGLRWNEQGETAYPSTFVLEKGGKVLFAKISREHGDRTTAADIAKAVERNGEQNSKR